MTLFLNWRSAKCNGCSCEKKGGKKGVGIWHKRKAAAIKTCFRTCTPSPKLISPWSPSQLLSPKIPKTEEPLWSLNHFRYPFHPRVTTVARKRSRSFCQKCRWQVTAKHAYTLRMWLCMKWHGAWLYGVHRTCAETAAVSCGTTHASAVSTPLRWIFKKNALWS